MFASIVEASTLGWTTAILAISTEMRIVGAAIAILAIILAAIRILLRNRLEDLGDTLTAISVGGGLLGSATAAAPTILGFVGAAPLVGTVLQPGWVESLFTVVTYWVTQVPIFVVGMWVWRQIRAGQQRLAFWRYVRRG